MQNTSSSLLTHELKMTLSRYPIKTLRYSVWSIHNLSSFIYHSFIKRKTIERILGPANKDYKILQYDFQGFGQARTLSLETAWEFFPQGTHIMIADPDWSPDTSTMDLNELDDDVSYSKQNT